MGGLPNPPPTPKMQTAPDANSLDADPLDADPLDADRPG